MSGMCCDLCGTEGTADDVKHLNLYVLESEGVMACLLCRIALADCAQGIRSAATRAYRRGAKARRNPELKQDGAKIAAGSDATVAGINGLITALKHQKSTPVSATEHRQHHIKLHMMLDELVSDWLLATSGWPSKATVLSLLQWSHLQTKEGKRNE